MGVLRRERGLTAYAVRRIFQVSLSAEWSGSAGAVYPAMTRLRIAGLIDAMAQDEDGRGTQSLKLTAKGQRAHDDWLCDVERAAGPGSDPFRTRAALWRELPAAKRRALMKALKKEIERRRGVLIAALPSRDEGDRLVDDILIAQLDLRLRWLEKQ